MGNGQSGEEPLPWFAFPKYGYQYSEFVYITVPMAPALLARNFKNRPRTTSTLTACLVTSRPSGGCKPTESIAINAELNTEDGQHRGKAIIKAGKAWPFYVTWGVPAESIFVIDSGKKRPVNQKLSFVIDSRMGTKTASLCRAMMMGLTGRGQRYTELELAEFGHKYIDAINWVAANYARCKGGTIRATSRPLSPRASSGGVKRSSNPSSSGMFKVNWLGGKRSRQGIVSVGDHRPRSEGRSNGVLCYKKALTALITHTRGTAPRQALHSRRRYFRVVARLGSSQPRHASKPASEVEDTRIELVYNPPSRGMIFIVPQARFMTWRKQWLNFVMKSSTCGLKNHGMSFWRAGTV